MEEEPVMDVAHLGHLELLTPKPEESLRVLRRRHGHDRERPRGRFGLSARLGRLRALFASTHGGEDRGLGHAAFRARSPQALQRRVKALKGPAWASAGSTSDLGHGPAYRCHDPDGHLDRNLLRDAMVSAAACAGPALKNQAQRFPARGVNVRRLDHFNCLAVDIKANREFFRSASASA